MGDLQMTLMSTRLLFIILWAIVEAKRDVMIWTQCDNATMKDLAAVRHSFTKVSPFNAGVERKSDGRVGIASSPPPEGLEACAKAVKSLPKDRVTGESVEYWPCVGLGNTGGAKGGTQQTMLDLFASPERFIADAVSYAKAYNVAGWNLDFEAY